MKIFFHKTASATSFSANKVYIDRSIKFQLLQYSYSKWIFLIFHLVIQSISLFILMFLLRKQPLVFLKITVSVLNVRDRCNFTKKWTTSPVSFKNFVYFLRAPFNGCFSYQYNISYRHIRVFVKNLIRFPDYKKSHFHSVFICFIARITWSTAAKITEKLILPVQHCFRIHQTRKSDYQACEKMPKLWSIGYVRFTFK